MNDNSAKLMENLGRERYTLPLDSNKKTKKDFSTIFTVEVPKRTLDKLIVPQKTKKQIASIMTKIKNYDLLYNRFGLKDIDTSAGRTLINFYGPPGTGKSFAAEAICYELGKKIIKANYAEIESKFVGETPKNIKALFRKAKEENAVLVFDEADSILGKRLSNVTQSTDYAVNVSKSVMILEMDNFSGIVIFTTNFGQNYDSAFVRRIIGHIEFTLPDFERRKEIFSNLIPERLPINLVEEAINEIIRLTEGFSGGDMLNMVIYAASSAVERDGKKCQVGLNDFLNAIEVIKEAKSEIGTSK